MAAVFEVVVGRVEVIGSVRAAEVQSPVPEHAMWKQSS